MENENPLMKSYKDTLEAGFWHETELMYEKHKEELGDSFNGSMKYLVKAIDGLRADCKPGTTWMEAALLMIACNLEEESTEDNKKLNELFKASVQWKLRQDFQNQSKVS